MSYVIALYMRLSLEDSKYYSMSISNQQLILRKKAMSLPEWEQAEILEFVDNGYTGTNFRFALSVKQAFTFLHQHHYFCFLQRT